MSPICRKKGIVLPCAHSLPSNRISGNIWKWNCRNFWSPKTNRAGHQVGIRSECPNDQVAVTTFGSGIGTFASMEAQGEKVQFRRRKRMRSWNHYRPHAGLGGKMVKPYPQDMNAPVREVSFLGGLFHGYRREQAAA